MALIESGTSADIFAEKPLDDKSNALKLGMLLTGGGIGFYLGVLSEKLFGIEEGLGTVPLTFIGGGLALILFYNIIKKRDE